MMDEKSLAELQKLSRPELVQVAQREGVELKPTWNRAQCAFAIKKKLLSMQQPTTSAASAPDGKPASVQESPKPANPDFEAVLKGETIDGRGGPRPGAGRLPGVTNKQSRLQNLPTVPNETVLNVLKAGFIFWEKKVKVPGIALTDEEANELGLHATRLLEFYCPDGIPDEFWLIAGAVASLAVIGNNKIELIKAAREAKAKEQGSVNAGQSGHSDNPGQVGVGQDKKGS